MTPSEIEACFTSPDGAYRFSRWGRPIVPNVFGVDDATLAVVKGAVEAVVALAGHKMAETDPELGANLMVYFLRDWQELAASPALVKLIPDLPAVVGRLEGADASQYRSFRFDENGAIQACFVFLRMDAQMMEVPAQTLALGQMAQAMLLWSQQAFEATSPLALIGEHKTVILRPEIGDLIKAAYDPVLPEMAQDAAHALRLYARLPRTD